MTIGEREDDVARREAEQAVGNDRKKTPPASDRPVEEPVERPHPDMEETPSARE